jgi:hypothetical protein
MDGAQNLAVPTEDDGLFVEYVADPIILQLANGPITAHGEETEINIEVGEFSCITVIYIVQHLHYRASRAKLAIIFYIRLLNFTFANVAPVFTVLRPFV